MNKETAELQAERFLTYVCLCPRVTKLIVNQWMTQYVPIPVQLLGPTHANRVPQSLYDTPGYWIAAVVARTLMQPTDLTLTGFYNMTQSANSVHGAPQYVMNAWTPTGDFSFSIPITILLDGHLDLLGENMTRLALYTNPEVHWDARVEGPGMMGHSYYHAFKHVPMMKRMYVPILYAVEVLYWMIQTMTQQIIEDMQPESCDWIIDMIHPLQPHDPVRNPMGYDPTQVPGQQQPFLAAVHDKLRKCATARDLCDCLAVIKKMRGIIHEMVAGMYQEQRKRLNKRMSPADAPALLALQ